jgi:hypothetical protein
MAHPEHRRAVNPARRRWAWAVAAAVLVVALVGGRWAAIETAERAWAATIPGGATYVAGRTLAALLRAAILLLAIAWGTANLYLVYRAIGAVQMPRRLGDLEIVETISRRVLLAGTVGSGVLFGLVLTWGTGDWWLAAVLAGAAPRTGLVDPVLQRDLGYYLATVPWAAQLQDHVLTGVASITAVVGLLYLGIGMIGRRGGAVTVSPRARLHLAALLAALALALAWGALLDPAETVGGLHGDISGPSLAARMRGAGTLTGVAVATALSSAVWGWTGRGAWLGVPWLVLLAGAPFVYVVLPATVRGQARSAPDTTAAEGRGLAAQAFGVRRLPDSLPTFAAPAAALRATPIWDEARVTNALRVLRPFGPRATVGGVALQPGTPPSWLVGPAPDELALRDTRPVPAWSEVHRGPWTSTGPPVIAVERDTGLAVRPVALRDTVVLYGPGVAQYAVRDPLDGLRGGVPLIGLWRRAAFAWTLQTTEVSAGAVAGHVLLWRRDVGDRLARLAPFAAFEPPQPVVADGVLWWVAWGYVHARAFPLIDAVPWRGRSVRYLRPGLVGAVAASSGETRIVLAPGYDSLAAAWSRAFAPLIGPPDSLPGAIRRQLPPPADAFDAALAAVGASEADSGWVLRAGPPVQSLAPAADGTDRTAVWRVHSFETGAPARLAALFAGTMTDAGPAYRLWRPAAPVRAPPPLLGVQRTRPGMLRVWLVGAAAIGIQGLFDNPETATRPTTLARVYVSWGERVGEGRTATAAWAALAADGDGATPGATGAALDWERARGLLARADSALRAGDLALFGRLYDELKRLFGLPAGQLAPTVRPD